MIRIILAQKGRLIRRALAQMLAQEDDVHVVAEVSAYDEAVTAAVRERPHVAVLDHALLGPPVAHDLCTDLLKAAPGCRILLIVDRSLPTLAGAELARMTPRVGLLATDASPGQLIEGVRRLSRGQPVLDVDIAVAALSANTTPLTRREREVLLLATEGRPTKEIAAKLCLTDGTVRNYLSRIVAKTGARTLIEAVRRAQESGWV
ncbi:response regulator transcription factor [Actinoplanes teichomyceticus]|uniref:LuxR family two component transcriptional regulator n=1 Tax=Actinoplanes teichomyceticus TaxID=1867 RepID=A0A561WA37_ACTTI|nr:response regulator transcription factor [Actinoplanes teichomyceticus]TWG20725.1 LuxR family two component transcriptional regulator [Actinoplanes teichomyceticus]GIF14381.1 DNA-binding response regulator [Actinoplanes teichomyceticus]